MLSLQKVSAMTKDIDATIKAFFMSVYEYVGKISDFYYFSGKNMAIIRYQEEVIKKQESLIAQLANEKCFGGDAGKLYEKVWEINTIECPSYHAFMKPGSDDNSALIAYREVIHGITDYLYYNMEPVAFLRSLKKWNYVISDNPFKDFVYPFLPLKHFVIKENQLQKT